jgi:hypothetical protein
MDTMVPGSYGYYRANLVKALHPLVRQTSAASASAVEEGPAFPVAEPLVVEHKFTNLDRKLRTLPPALSTTHVIAIVWTRCCTDGPDGIRSRAKLVVCHMGHRHCVTGCASRFLGGPGSLPGRIVCGIGRGARLSHRDPTTRPHTCLLDRPTRTLVPGMRLLEEVQYVLRASRSPHRKKAMIGVLKGATATHGDKPGVSAPLVVHDQRIHF